MFPRHPFSLLASAVLVFGTTALVLSWVVSPSHLSPELALLLVAALVSENYAVLMPGFSFSIVYPLTMATAVLCGPTAAILMAAVTAVSIRDMQERDWPLVAFNLGQLVLSAAVASWAYVGLGAPVLLSERTAGFVPGDFPLVLLPLALMAILGVASNIALACLGVAARYGRPLLTVLESVGLLPWGQVALGVVAFVMAQVMAINMLAFALFVFPLLVARQFYQRFTALQAAYTDTIRSLVGALEAKDPYTRGHSERVAQYAVLLGRRLGFNDRAVNDLENTALLHDLGKLALPGQLLRKQGSLDSGEWRDMREHPALGADMIRRIPPLRVLADAVHQHHERLDGSGYPDGLDGSEIIKTARVLAVADSYDAMTSDRPYRKGLSHSVAVEELRVCAESSQLDGHVVEELVAALLEGGFVVDSPEESRSTWTGASG